MKIILKRGFSYFLLFIISLCLFSCNLNQTKTTDTDEKTSVVVDVNQFSRLPKADLISKMGEPSSTEDWTNKTSKGDFNVTTYFYDIDNIHYEFIITDDTVVRLSLYSEKFWSNKGDKFSYDHKKNIPSMFGIELNDNARRKADNGFTYILSPVSDKVAHLNVQDMDSDLKTFGLIKITYNLHYFD